MTSVIVKRDRTAVLPELEESLVMVLDLTMPEMSEKSIAATPHIKLFFVLVAVQTLPIWIIADLGLLRNQIDKAVYKNFQFKPSLEIQKMCE